MPVCSLIFILSEQKASTTQNDGDHSAGSTSKTETGSCHGSGNESCSKNSDDSEDCTERISGSDQNHRNQAKKRGVLKGKLDSKARGKKDKLIHQKESRKQSEERPDKQPKQKVIKQEPRSKISQHELLQQGKQRKSPGSVPQARPW